ncbi:MAG: J domain-containing protein [Candidatus Kapaibacterium sp.]
MGQLFDRLKRYAKVHISPEENKRTSFRMGSEDDELRKIINELNRDAYEQEDASSKSKDSGNKSQSHVMDETRALTVLGLAKGASKEEIKAAYKKKMTEYHPDKVEHLGEEIRNLAAQKTKEIIAAYNYLNR